MSIRSFIAVGPVCLLLPFVWIVAARVAGPDHALADSWLQARGPRTPWVPVSQIDRAVVAESSGIIASRQHPGVFWTHSDSFNEPAIVAVRLDGSILAKFSVAAPNWDWEDIATDDDGFLYIADIGNNFGWFSGRTIYKIREPDPRDPAATPIHPTAVYTFHYPQDRRFDAEGFFVRAGKMYLVSKRDQGRTRIYRFDSAADGVTSIHEIVALDMQGATGADVSPRGDRLAVCTVRSVRLYAVGDDLASVAIQKPLLIRFPSDEVEACAFSGEALVLTNERGEMFHLSARDITRQTIFVPPPPPPTDPTVDPLRGEKILQPTPLP